MWGALVSTTPPKHSALNSGGGAETPSYHEIHCPPSEVEGQSRQLILMHCLRVEGVAWPGTGATTEFWDIQSHVFMETTHQTYVYQASDSGTTSRLCVWPHALGWGDTWNRGASWAM